MAPKWIGRGAGDFECKSRAVRESHRCFVFGGFNVLPILPIVFGALFGASTGGLIWYFRLSPERQKEADSHAADLASRLYDQGLDELTSAQLARVHALTKDRFSK